MTILDRGRIEDSGATTLQELLGSELGVNVFDEIGNGRQAVVELRGFNNTPVPSVAVIVDGVRVNEANFGQVNYHLIPLENVERVEIHRGPSTMFGKNALGGVIHITTRRPDKLEKLRVETGQAFGSYDRKKTWGIIDGTVGRVSYLISVSKENDHGYRQNSEADINNAFVKTSVKFSEGSEGTLTYTRSDDRLNQPGSLTSAEIAVDETQHVSTVLTRNRLDFFNYNHRLALPFGVSLAGNAYLLKEEARDDPVEQGSNVGF